ncbi:hypothetical protein GUJ93_ZPchr0011g27214 [Zizania palustris]|uniref:Uncharacterized protein n=1 Tax=Zizania palustris TaxID=103762 RepID=A0A8J6BMU0_ZIZPA|nr:hypothetical protein GUJ93_ZPchr0011g27214 [Zizania palustris]
MRPTGEASGWRSGPLGKVASGEGARREAWVTGGGGWRRRRSAVEAFGGGGVRLEEWSGGGGIRWVEWAGRGGSRWGRR